MIFVFGEGREWELDEGVRELRRGGRKVPAQPKVLALLLHLVRNRDRVVPKRELLDVLWPDEIVGETSLTRAVRGARRALEDSGHRQDVIQNARGHGYRFISPVEERGAAAESEAPLHPPARGHFFVGRETLLEALDDHLELAFQGTCQLVWISGPPGIGKTRLIEVFAERARRRVAECLIGRCIEADGAPPFWPWAQIVRSYARGRSPAALREALGHGATDVAQAIPALAEFLPELPAPPDIDPTQTRFRLHQSFAEFLRRACAARPLVVILDDLHRADQASLGLLEHLLRELHDVGITFVGTLRSTTRLGGKRAELLAKLGQMQPEGTYPLGGLQSKEIAHFVARSTGKTPGDDLVYSLEDRTQGNPLFLGELLSHSTATGGELPRASGVRDAIRRHLEDLSAPCQASLQIAAVLGRDFGIGTVAHAAGLPMEKLLLQLDEAVAARVVEALPDGVGRFRFRHGLIPEVLVGELPPSRRVHLHDAVGRALCDQFGAEPGERQAEIAHHFVEAAPAGERNRAVEACLAAAAHAASVAAFSEAARHIDAALGVVELGPSSPSERADLLTRAGEHWTEAGELTTARGRLRRSAQIARATGDHALFTRAALAAQRSDETGQVDDERVALLAEARANLAPHDSADHVRVVAALAEASYFADPPERALKLSAEAVSMARRVDDAAALAMALRARHVVMRHPDGLEERQRITDEWVALTERLGNREQLAHALAARFQDSLERGDREAVDRDFAAHAQLARELRQPYFGWHAELHGALVTLLAGSIEQAEAHASKAHERGKAIQAELAGQWYGVQLFLIRREQGRLEELRPGIEQLAADYPVISTWRAALALIDTEAGELAEARRRLRGVAADDLVTVRSDVNTLITLAVLAEVALRVDDAATAAVLERRLLPYAGRFVAIGLSAAGYGACCRYLGMVVEAQGRIDEALEYYRSATTLDRHMGARAFLARGRIDLARAYCRRDQEGDRARATQLLADAEAEADQLGMLAAVDDARALRARMQGAIPLPRTRRR
ncbi:MAG: AAA family ATPase [Deltaproteobacteria bacterium]|nr:AAA family ATPase [Deltaproteobacteria bacterium]